MTKINRQQQLSDSILLIEWNEEEKKNQRNASFGIIWLCMACAFRHRKRKTKIGTTESYIQVLIYNIYVDMCEIKPILKLIQDANQLKWKHLPKNDM